LALLKTKFWPPAKNLFCQGRPWQSRIISFLANGNEILPYLYFREEKRNIGSFDLRSEEFFWLHFEGMKRVSSSCFLDE
jgi:hypothetical protein